MLLPSPELSTEGPRLTWPGEDSLWGPCLSHALLFLESLSGQIEHTACKGQSPALCRGPAPVLVWLFRMLPPSEQPCSADIVTNSVSQNSSVRAKDDCSGEAADLGGMSPVPVLFVLTAVYSVSIWELNERGNKVHRAAATFATCTYALHTWRPA